MNTAIETARKLAREFADYLNSRPDEAQNWSPLGRFSELPEFDYVELRNQFGDVTGEIEDAYRDTFNDVFNPLS